jgi:hypothetical protein
VTAVYSSAPQQIWPMLSISISNLQHIYNSPWDVSLVEWRIWNDKNNHRLGPQPLIPTTPSGLIKKDV